MIKIKHTITIKGISDLKRISKQEKKQLNPLGDFEISLTR